MDLRDDPRIKELNDKIQVERDPARLAELSEELSRVIDQYRANSSTHSVNDDPTQKPEWRTKYVAAVLEANHDKLTEKIRDAEHAIRRRLHVLDGKPDAEEWIELNHALKALETLWNQRRSH